MSTPVFYHSDMPGFPAGITTVAGGAIAVLDACLVNGANLAGLTTLVRAAGTATATTASNHNFNVGDKVLVSGATPTAYNGLKTITAKTSTTFSFAVDAATASPASGTIEAKHPGAGWAKTFTGTNIAAYRSATSDGGMGHYLQVEDNNPYNDSFGSFRLRAALGHTGLDTATRLLPARRLSRSGGSTQNRWWVVADDRTAYVYFYNDNPNHPKEMMVFGELTPVSAVDDGAWVVQGSGGGASASDQIFYPLTRSVSPAGIGTDTLQAVKSGTGLEAPAHIVTSMLGMVQGADLHAVQTLYALPNALSGAVNLMPVLAAEALDSNNSAGRSMLRGSFRGVYQPYGLFSAAVFGANHTFKLPNIDIGGVTKDLLIVRSHSGGTSFNCQLAFDLSGPWG